MVYLMCDFGQRFNFLSANAAFENKYSIEIELRFPIWAEAMFMMCCERTIVQQFHVIKLLKLTGHNGVVRVKAANLPTVLQTVSNNALLNTTQFSI